MGYVTAGLTALSALGLAPLLSMPDQMYESAIKQGPQGVDGEYKIGPGRWLLGQFDPRFTKEGLKKGNIDYITKETLDNPAVLDALSYDVRKPLPGETVDKYLASIRSPLRTARRKEKIGELSDLRQFQWNDPFAVAQREEAKLRRLREDRRYDLELQILNRDSERQYDYQTQLLMNQKNQMQNNLNVQMGELALKQQEAGWKNDLYQQQLKDNKEYKQQALLAAALDGLGMTITGLVKG